MLVDGQLGSRRHVRDEDLDRCKFPMPPLTPRVGVGVGASDDIRRGAADRAVPIVPAVGGVPSPQSIVAVKSAIDDNVGWRR